MVTRAELGAMRLAGSQQDSRSLSALKRQREAGPDSGGIEVNRRVLYDVAMTSAHTALVDSEDAVAGVEAAANLAAAQTAVSGLSATLAGAKSGIEGVRTDLA
jgi:hypothetical protein